MRASLRDVITIASRDLRSAVSTPLFFLLAAGYLVLCGFFFFSLLIQFNSVLEQASLIPGTSTSLNLWVISPWFQAIEILLLFLLPVVAMRSFAEERALGTYELLRTSPVSDGGIIWGKLLGVFLQTTILQLLALIFPLSLVILSEPEFMPIVTGFIGQLLFSVAILSLCVALSALNSSQTLAAASGIATSLLLYLADAPAERIGGKAAAFLTFITLGNHTEKLYRGVIELPDVVFLLSVLAIGVFFTHRILESERVR